MSGLCGSSPRSQRDVTSRSLMFDLTTTGAAAGPRWIPGGHFLCVASFPSGLPALICSSGRAGCVWPGLAAAPAREARESALLLVANTARTCCQRYTCSVQQSAITPPGSSNFMLCLP